MWGSTGFCLHCCSSLQGVQHLTALKSTDGTVYKRAGAVESTVAVLLEEDTESPEKGILLSLASEKQPSCCLSAKPKHFPFKMQEGSKPKSMFYLVHMR